MNAVTDYGPFAGDGRGMIEPPERFKLASQQPKALRRSTARLVIDEFCRYGLSNHSSHGSTLWVLLWWCEFHRRKYVLSVEEHGTCLFLDGVPPGVST